MRGCALWASLLPMVALACGPKRPTARPTPPPTVAELEQAWSTRQQRVTSMDARVRATSWLGGERVRATVLMLVDRAGRLRFEAEVSLQGTVAVLATDLLRFEFLDVQRNELRRGPACPANVASLVRIPLAPPEVAAILLGDALRPEAMGSAARTPASAQGTARAPTVEWDADARADVLVVPRHDGWLRLSWQNWPASQPGPQATSARPERLVAVAATDADGRPRWRVAYDDFKEVVPPGTSRAVAMPSMIRFAQGAASFDEGVEIKVKEQSLNPALDPAAFTVTAPAGTPTLEVGCGPAP